MSEFLVIRLDRAPDGPAYWILVDETGALLGTVDTGALQQAAALAAGRRVVVLVPATSVLRTRVEVPVKSTGKLMQALPFALEEQVADDVDDLHFAAGIRADDRRMPVAVVRREIIDGWLQRLAAAGIEAQSLYADSDAVGCIPNTAILMLQEDCTVLADPDGNLLAMDPDSVESMVDLWLARRQADSADSRPLHMMVYGSPPLLDAFIPRLEKLRPLAQTLEFHALPEGPLPRLAARIVTTPGIDLLQGPYARRTNFMAWWPAWRVAASLLVAVLVLSVIVEVFEIRSLRREVGRLDATIEEAFHYVFPDAGPVTDPQAELSARLLQLGGQQSGASREFLDTLGVLARALGPDSEIRIEAFNYRPGSLDLRLRTPSVELLDRLQHSVTETGTLNAQIQSANASGDEFVGRLQITRSGG